MTPHEMRVSGKALALRWLAQKAETQADDDDLPEAEGNDRLSRRVRAALRGLAAKLNDAAERIEAS